MQSHNWLQCEVGTIICTSINYSTYEFTFLWRVMTNAPVCAQAYIRTYAHCHDWVSLVGEELVSMEPVLV